MHRGLRSLMPRCGESPAGQPPRNNTAGEKIIIYDESSTLSGRHERLQRPDEPIAREMFGEPISVYTDAQAVEDDFIVDLAKFTNVRFLGLPINRMTHLYDDLEPFAKSAAETLYDGNLGSAFGCLFATKIRFAQGDPGNTGEVGDIYTIPPTLWLVRNEVGGWTAMYPEDY
jgi:hypothetical protein